MIIIIVESISNVIEEIREGMEFFSGMKKNDLDELRNLNDLINMDYFKNLMGSDET